MVRGVTLLNIVTQVRNEVGRDPDVSVGQSDIEGIKQKVRRVYETLYDEEWPHLHSQFDKIQLQAGQRYYDPPTSINGVAGFTVDYERLDKTYVWYSGLPHPLKYGIGPQEYASFDSTNDVRTEPALRWDVRFTGVKEQIEIWPIPSSNTQYLQFEGVPRCSQLVSESDTLALDDKLIVLLVAAELAEVQDSKSAKSLAQLATKRYFRLTGRARKTSGHRIGMKRRIEPEQYRGIIRVR